MNTRTKFPGKGRERDSVVRIEIAAEFKRRFSFVDGVTREEFHRRDSGARIAGETGGGRVCLNTPVGGYTGSPKYQPRRHTPASRSHVARRSDGDDFLT